MKNRYITSIIHIILGVLLILIPTVLFPVCPSDEMRMSCFYTSKAEIGLGILSIILGIAELIASKDEIRAGLGIAQAAVAVLVLLYPLKLTGLCGMSDMRCRVQTLPALIVFSVILFVFSAINVVYLLKRSSAEFEEGFIRF